MKITILAFGSEGDVRPYVALGEGLRTNGHTIRFATDHAFEAMVASRGLEFARLSGNIRAWADAGEPARSQKAGNPVSLARHVSGLQKNFALNWGQEVLAASCDADCLIVGVTATWFGASIAEKLTIPCIHAWFLPLAPTREFVSP
jgi:UDP:flavonoid glycosyltransferase YjiC (YdhE family)